MRLFWCKELCQFDKIVRLWKSNMVFLEDRFEIFLRALLAVKANRIPGDCLTRPQ